MQQIAYQLGYITAGILTLLGLLIGIIKITNNKKREQKPKKTKNKPTKPIKTLIPIVILATTTLTICVVFLCIKNPSETLISKRLNEVLNVCTGNEASQECKRIQNKYGLYFSYCRAYYNIPEINKKIPIYAVSSIDNPYALNKSAEDMTPYYACTNNLSGKILNDTDFVELDAQASNLLRQKPHVSFNADTCTASIMTFWDNIPNFENIKTSTTTKVFGCPLNNNLIEQQTNNLDKTLDSYASNPVVREYFKGFDRWNASINQGKCIYEKGKPNERTYNGACITKKEDENYPLNGFPKYMKAKENTNKYTAKLIDY